MSRWKGIVQNIFSIFYLLLIILTIPLTFDLGGEDCGVSYTFILSVYYFAMSSIRIITRNTRVRMIGSLVYYTQHIIILSLLILFLNLFNDTSNDVLITLSFPWKILIEHSTPIFTILEGFCTLLVIQTIGQVLKLLSRKNENWMFIQLVMSGIIITSSLYFLYQIYYYTFPESLTQINIINWSLIGSVLTLAVVVGIYGIVSNRGSSIESSLMFSYMVYCLYFTFTNDLTALFGPTSTCTNNSGIGDSIGGMIEGFLYKFLNGAFLLPASIIIILTYRLGIFYAATRIIPVLHNNNTAINKPHSKSKLLIFTIYAYAPIIIIAVYTHLLMQHFYNTANTTASYSGYSSSMAWNWVNMFTTLTLYGMELIYNNNDLLIENHLKNQ